MATKQDKSVGSAVVLEPAVPAGPRRAGARADKLWVLIQASRNVFARAGYSRASIEVIAAEAGISTRTIYNHFESKEQLFAFVVHESAAQVADQFIADTERRLDGADPGADLYALGLVFAGLRKKFPEHFAMVDQARIEAPYFPAAIIESWREAGPRRILAELIRHLGQIAETGFIEIEDPRLAAVHFLALITAEMQARPLPLLSLTDDEVRVGVNAFLKGYGRDPKQESA